MEEKPIEILKKPGFFKEHVLPLFLIFLVPGFSLWFFTAAERRLDDEASRQVLASVKSDREVSEEDRQAWVEFFRETRVSEVMASSKPEALHLQQAFEPVKFRYGVFRWCKRIAMACLGSALFAFVFVGIGARFSLRSQEAQYRVLRSGWPVIRGVAVLQVVGQAVLAVALSFWVTALWFELYSMKLIAVIGILAVTGIFVIVKAMFTRQESRFEQQGELIGDDVAPGLWQHVREVAARLGTAPPDQIIAGIDASFFVTEHDVVLDGSVQKGRTLFVSLPLLKVLSVEEADAVLAHEMAHFSGDDTLWSRRISPFVQRMGLYLQALYGAALTRPVFHFMLFFWKIYNYSLGKMSRSREFRADSIGATQSSPGALARALVKISAYCEYLGKTEQAIIEKRGLEKDLHLADRLDTGFAGYLTGFTGNKDAVLAETPHPFDTHPPLSSRMEALGLVPDDVLGDAALHEPVRQSWRNAVAQAAEIEARLWSAQERAMQEFHEIHLAWTLTPASEEDLAIVVRHFPELSFFDGKGETATMDHRSLRLSSWPQAILFRDIEKLELNESLGKKVLTLHHHAPEGGPTAKVKFAPDSFKGGDGDLLAALGRYYGRYQTAAEHQARG